jgi:uncharacterized membrane protein
VIGARNDTIATTSASVAGRVQNFSLRPAMAKTDQRIDHLDPVVAREERGHDDESDRHQIENQDRITKNLRVPAVAFVIMPQPL